VIRRQNLLVALGVLALCAGCVRPERDNKQESAAAADPTPADPVPEAAPIPAPAGALGGLTELSGPELLARIRAGKAKGTIVNAWASWCGPCKEEFPMLVALRKKLAPRGIELLFVSVDEPETHAAAQTFAAEYGITGELLVARRPLGPFKQALNPDWPGMLPATFLFGPDGKLRHFWGGPVYENELMPTIEDFLAGKKVDGQTMPGLSPGLDLRPTPP
jgi:thiol-disulfide isomerase/thioredoxin